MQNNVHKNIKFVAQLITTDWLWVINCAVNLLFIDTINKVPLKNRFIVKCFREEHKKREDDGQEDTF